MTEISASSGRNVVISHEQGTSNSRCLPFPLSCFFEASCLCAMHSYCFNGEANSYPGNSRRASFAIRAFNAELASIRDQVSNASIGQGRLVFWRDAINKVRWSTSPPPTSNGDLKMNNLKISVPRYVISSCKSSSIFDLSVVYKNLSMSTRNGCDHQGPNHNN